MREHIRKSSLRKAWLVGGLLMLATAVALWLNRPTRLPRFAGTLILTVDCMRPDHVSCYGYEHETTPAIDAVARDGIRFERCYAQSSWTKPSVASLFSGMYVRSHGVTIGSKIFDREGGTEEVDKTVGTYPVPPDIPLLAESMRAAGHRTVGIVENSHLVPAQGFGRGFDFYDRLKDAVPHLRRWFEDAPLPSLEDPVFCYVHLIGPHDPYDNNRQGFAEFRRRFGEYESDVDFLSLDYKKSGRMGEEDVGQARALYDAELAYFDARQVHPLMHWLRLEGVYDDMLIIITADHGEELYDHQGWAHGHALHEEVIRVPLIVKLPRDFSGLPPGSVVDEPVELIDIFPTLAEFVGVEVPPGCEGQSLTSLLLGERESDPEAVAISEHAIGLTDQVLGVAVVRGNQKLVVRYPSIEFVHELKMTVDRDRVVYDLGADPDELIDQSQSAPHVGSELERILVQRLGESYRIRRALPERVLLDEESLDDLRGLGYLSDEDSSGPPSGTQSPERRP